MKVLNPRPPSNTVLKEIVEGRTAKDDTTPNTRLNLVDAETVIRDAFRMDIDLARLVAMGVESYCIQGDHGGPALELFFKGQDENARVEVHSESVSVLDVITDLNVQRTTPTTISYQNVDEADIQSDGGRKYVTS